MKQNGNATNINNCLLIHNWDQAILTNLKDKPHFVICKWEIGSQENISRAEINEGLLNVSIIASRKVMPY